ncbi:MAG: hypothetical protein PHQ64_04015 [Bacilli bacterium]|nr:hypothetical protein [Bacilli bacterium]
MKQKKLAILNRFLMLAINLLYVLLVVYFIGHYIEVKSLPMCSNEIILLMILTIIKSCQTIIPNGKRTSVTVFGKKITKSTKKKVRMLNYFYEALYFSMLLTTTLIIMVVFNKLFIDYYSVIPNNLVISITVVTLIFFVVSVAVLFAIDYFVREKHISTNKKEA